MAKIPIFGCAFYSRFVLRDDDLVPKQRATSILSNLYSK